MNGDDVPFIVVRYLPFIYKEYLRCIDKEEIEKRSLLYESFDLHTRWILGLEAMYSVGYDTCCDYIILRSFLSHRKHKHDLTLTTLHSHTSNY